MSRLDDDFKRLVDIGDQVVAGKPFEEFDLGRYERAFVLAYCKRAVEDFLGPAEPVGHRSTEG
jgi:hypothetical protein